ncbi:hypothetical protein ABEV41_00135 [Geobacillus thermodenitrificans]|uniref:hypothetical protein n=1 Tax=Geobacillus thermodenitrificans TaxID=33940 RepID=UPI003D239F5E
MSNNYSPTPQEAKFKQSIIKALKEVELIRKGKLPKKTAREMLKEVKEELHSK